MMRMIIVVFVAALLLPAGAACAQDGLPPLLDREVFFGDPEIAGAQLSPDGAYVSFRRPLDGVMNIWVKGIDEPFEVARPITADTQRPITGYFWSRDGRYVLFVQDRGGDENFHVYAVDPRRARDGHIPEPRNLTPVDGITARIYEVPRNVPETIIVGINDRDPSFHDVYRVSLATGERELIFENTENLAGFFFNDDGEAVGAGRQLPGGAGLEFLPITDGEIGEAFYTCTFEEQCSPVQLHPDGRRIYMRTNRGENVDLARLMLFDPETGLEVPVHDDPEGEVDLAGAAFSEVTHELLATFYLGDRLRIYPHNQQFARDLLAIREQLPDGDLSFTSRTADERLWLVSVASDVDPGSVYVYDRETGEASFLYRSRPDFPVQHMAEMTPVRYTARDGLEIPAYLTLPRGIESRNLPVVMFIHGGPWARDVWGYSSFAQFLANRGYAVLQPNFRGSSGYGKAFLNAGNREWGTGYMQHDITDGVQWLIEQGIADPERIGIFGGSYGGYATLAGVTFTPDLYAAAVPYVAPSSLITLIESFPAYWRPVLEMTWYRRVGDPGDPADRAYLDARSPLNFVERITTPLLVVHGANDMRVTQRESDQLVVALRDRGIDVEYIVAPDEGHGFQGEYNRLGLAAAMERFLAEHLGGRYQPEVRPAISERLAAITVDPATVELTETVDPGAFEAARFHGDRVVPVTLTYHTRMSVMGQDLELEQTSTAEEAEFEGLPAWRFTSTGALMGQQLADTVYAARQTLTPLARHIHQGPMRIEVEYGEGTVTATAGQMGTVQATFDGPIAVDGAAFDAAIGALPIDEGYRAQVQLFDAASASVKSYTLAVTGTETVTVPAGTFEAYVIELRPADGSTPRTLHVSMEAPRVVVRQVMPLPAQMGGGTAVSELTSVAR